MMKRWLGMVVALSVAGQANAQASGTPEELVARIRTAYDTFWLTHQGEDDSQSFALFQETVDSFENRDTTYQTWVTWFSNRMAGRDELKVQVYTLKDGKPFQRIVGDGETLWNYNYATNEYSARVYGKFQGKQPENYRAIFGKQLAEAVPSRASAAVRFATELSLNDGPSFRTWLAGVVPFGPKDSGAVTYMMRDESKKVVFDISEEGEFMAIRMDETQSINRRPRVIQTMIREYTAAEMGGPILTSNEGFVFTPPRGARSIPVSRATAGQ